jgi:hypothetical protein
VPSEALAKEGERNWNIDLLRAAAQSAAMADSLTLEEKRARIEQLRADLELKRAEVELNLLDRIKRNQDITMEPWKLAFAGVTAGATLIGVSVGATLAIVKALGG